MNLSPLNLMSVILLKLGLIGYCYLQPCRRVLKHKAKQQLHLLDIM